MKSGRLLTWRILEGMAATMFRPAATKENQRQPNMAATILRPTATQEILILSALGDYRGMTVGRAFWSGATTE